jgi:Ca2+:H+ antiporter
LRLPVASAWLFPALVVLLIAAATVTHYEFGLSPFGLLFAMLLVMLFGTVFAAVHTRK